MKKSQWAMVAARTKDYYAKQAKERQKEHGGTAPGKTKNTSCKIALSDSSGTASDQAGEAVGVSDWSVDSNLSISRRWECKSAKPTLCASRQRQIGRQDESEHLGN